MSLSMDWPSALVLIVGMLALAIVAASYFSATGGRK